MATVKRTTKDVIEESASAAEEIREVAADLMDVVDLRRAEVEKLRQVAEELAAERKMYEEKIPVQRERIAGLREKAAANEETLEELRIALDDGYSKVGRTFTELKNLQRTLKELHAEAAETVAAAKPAPVASPPPVAPAPAPPPPAAPPRYRFAGTVGHDAGEWVSVFVAGSDRLLCRQQTGPNGRLDLELPAEVAEIVVESVPGKRNLVTGEKIS